jgi:hypothetical protein
MRGASARAPRIEVDFNYGGIVGDAGIVYLSPKRGDRSGIDQRARAELAAAGVEPTEGLKVLLVDPRADLDDDGTVCDMVVIGTLTWTDDGSGWRARYEASAMEWIPSDER